MLTLALLAAAAPTPSNTVQPRDQVAKVNELLAQETGNCMRRCTTFEKLHWWGASIGDAGCVELFRKLVSKQQHVVNLLLGSNFLGPECADAIAATSKTGLLRKVSALGLSRNQLGDAGVSLLAQAFHREGLLPVDLYLSKNSISALGLSALASRMRHLKPRLTRLHLVDNTIDDDGALLLARALTAHRGGRGLKLLNLNNNSLGNSSVAPLAKALAIGGELSLNGNRIGDAGANELTAAIDEGLVRLHTISLRRNSISPQAQASLRAACTRAAIKINLR
ncbi:hypothetical protein AB1Y20_003198 [Prymnesium parvum]|uniref:Uncharacterized protein n=1 Tax=Prymnesium parvum TaxID=97485 RepID=A0AB34JDM1_PRYPA